MRKVRVISRDRRIFFIVWVDIEIFFGKRREVSTKCTFLRHELWSKIAFLPCLLGNFYLNSISFRATLRKSMAVPLPLKSENLLVLT
jgi:hypothetical protein